jgi:predicted esterase
VATICRWAARASLAPDRLILWAGSLPDELRTGPGLFGAARVTLVLGDDDPYGRDGADRRIIAHLEECGVPFEVVRFPGGHELDAGVLRGLAGGPAGSP